MKIKLTIAAAALLAGTAALAQTMGTTTQPESPPMTTSDPAMSAPSTITETPAPSTSTSAPNDAMASNSGVTLTKRDGKWYNGDTLATKSEIAEYKKSMKKPS